MNHDQSELDPITLAAIDWMVRLESGTATTEDHQKFQTWLAADVRHQQAWQALKQQIDEPFVQLQQLSIDTSLPSKSFTSSLIQSQQRRNRKITQSGLFIVLLSSAFMLWIWLKQTRPLSFIQADYYTQTAEQKTIQLEDKSSLTLAPYSAVQVKFNAQQRDIYLLNGAVVATVSADPKRPFIVHTEQAKMQALGTVFMVQQHDAYSDLAVLEHSVKASTATQSQRVLQGQAVRVDQKNIRPLATDAAHISSWKEGVLDVEDVSLAEFIQMIQPYDRRSIYLSQDVKSQRIYGVFYLKDTDKILEILQMTKSLKIYKGLGFVYISQAN